MAVDPRKLEMQFFRNMKVYDRRPAEAELQSQAGWQGDQDGFSIGLVCRHPSIGVPANDLLHVCKQSGQTRSVQNNVG